MSERSASPPRLSVGCSIAAVRLQRNSCHQSVTVSAERHACRRRKSLRCQRPTSVTSFLAAWHKRPLNQALVSFALVCSYIGSFVVCLFGFLCCWLQLCLVLSISVKWLVEKAECIAPVKRLAGKIAYEITSDMSGIEQYCHGLSLIWLANITDHPPRLCLSRVITLPCNAMVCYCWNVCLQCSLFADYIGLSVHFWCHFRILRFYYLAYCFSVLHILIIPLLIATLSVLLCCDGLNHAAQSPRLSTVCKYNSF